VLLLQATIEVEGQQEQEDVLQVASWLLLLLLLLLPLTPTPVHHRVHAFAAAVLQVRYFLHAPLML